MAATIDSATRTVADFGGRDFRGPDYTHFKVADNHSDFDAVREAFTSSLLVPSVLRAGNLQSAIDEMTAWALDLHKKYDYKAPTPDNGSTPPPPPIVHGALTVSPTSLTISTDSPQQIQISSGGQAAPFTAKVWSDTGWLLIGLSGSPAQPSTGQVTGMAPDRGTFNLIAAVSSSNLTNQSQTGLITIDGTGSAAGETLVNVTFKASSQPSPDDLAALRLIDDRLDRAKAVLSLISDNTKALEAAQATLRTAYVALLKVEDDFARRKAQGVVVEQDKALIQYFNLGTDRKTTSAGYLACVSDIDGKTPTTTNLNYTLLYQNVPHWSASAGFLTSFLEKKIIGLTDTNTSTDPSTPNDVQSFQITDHSPVQLVPMAFVNYRIGKYKSTQYGKRKEDELVWTTALSAGLGINPNTGTNQPEFFWASQ